MHICGKVLIVDGDSRSRARFRDLFDQAGLKTVEAATSEEALSRVASESPDLVILDVDSPDVRAYVVCRLMRETYGELLPIVLTSAARVEVTDRVAGLLLGADDYVVRPYDSTELLVRVRRLCARYSATERSPVSGPANGNGADKFDLTPREQEILRLLLSGMSQSEIAAKLVISPNTVATHIRRILLKLGVHNRAQAVAKAARAGWMDDGLASVEPQLEPVEMPRRAGTR